MKLGRHNLITDVPGILVGNSHDITLKSGVTVVLSDKPMTASCFVMGGAPGTRDIDLLEPDKSVAKINAVVLSGGSAYGLDACTGVTSRLRTLECGFRVGDAIVPIVPGAIIFDLLNGGQKDWKANPYPELGEQAFDNASSNLSLGSVGAGTGALTATLKGGLGSASFILNNGISVGALVVVNSIGAVTTPGEKYFWAAPFEINDEFGGLGPDPRSALGLEFVGKKMLPNQAHCKTTIATVATDATLTKAMAKRVATSAHDGFARAIVPSHMPNDGDLVFSLSTDHHQTPITENELQEICHATAICVTRAIARAIYCAKPNQTDLLPAWCQVNLE
ncbi:MAG: P1 family peptidase [Aestuariivita sp.]|nr:P1 family peptidase [Aestuariivita sp.]